MALIKCDECLKEISDKVEACPHCGYPIKGDLNRGIMQDKNKLSTKKTKAIIGVIALIVVCGLVVAGGYYSIVVKPSQTYAKAMSLLTKGDYEEATILLEGIKDYEDVPVVMEQMKYESVVYNCIDSFKGHLKNPDSFQAYDIQFYNMKNESEQVSKEPICIMKYGAQNGFGGNTTGYVLFMYSEDKQAYSAAGTCDTLEQEDIDEDDELDILTCKVINLYIKQGEKIGDVDMSRVKTVLKNDAYSTIKIIE